MSDWHLHLDHDGIWLDSSRTKSGINKFCQPTGDLGHRLFLPSPHDSKIGGRLNLENLVEVVNRWLMLMWNDIDSARKEQKSDIHLLKGIREHPQAINAVCPSQNKWPLTCPCVERHFFHDKQAAFEWRKVTPSPLPQCCLLLGQIALLSIPSWPR